MKTTPIKKTKSCTPSDGGVMTAISPQRGPLLASWRGTPIFIILYQFFKPLVRLYLGLSTQHNIQNRVKKGFANIIFAQLFGFALLIGFSDPSYALTASWYSTEACRFNPDKDCPTASGKSLYQLEKDHVNFAASYRYALGTRVKVTNLRTSKSVIVRIWDRGPNKRLGREIDLGKRAFAEIASLREGVIPVSVEVVK